MTAALVSVVIVGVIACGWLAVIASHLRDVARSLRILADVERSRLHSEDAERRPFLNRHV
jgi:hypothetical protein